MGENNAGKSSVLEALLVYANNASPYILDNIASFHQEETLSEQYQLRQFKLHHALNKEFRVFSSIFYQRQYPKRPNDNIVIGELNNNVLTLTYDRENNEILVVSPSKEKNTIPLTILNESHYMKLETIEIFLKSFYIPTGFILNQILATHWEQIILTPYENEVIKSLQIIEPNIEKLAFISNPLNQNDRIPMVSLKNSEKPIPLYSMGDGIKRILQLILNLHQAKDGLLLIDEFDNGLHYKVQEKVWGLLFELAERFNVQVFATTHSNDCIRAFSNISQERTDIDGMLIQMTKEHYKDGTSQIVANVVDEESLEYLLNLGVDVR